MYRRQTGNRLSFLLLSVTMVTFPPASWCDPPAAGEDCSPGRIRQTAPGTFHIVGHLEATPPNAGYQADSAAAGPAEEAQEQLRAQRPRGSEESWQKLQPLVECGNDSMVLVVRKRRAGSLLLGRGDKPPVALSKLPPRCGYSVQTTWRDLSVTAKYNACHVIQEGDSYVLPLLWRGALVKMSCPVPQIVPHGPGQHSACCSPYGMKVNLHGPTPAEQLRLNVRGQWIPLVSLTEHCGFTVDRRDTQNVITAPYLTCGMTVKDGKHTLYLQIGKIKLLVSCPVSSLEASPGTRLVGGPDRQPLSGAFPWPTPFYLAPLYYPHPTYHEPTSVHHPLPPSFSSPDPGFGPQPPPPVDSQYPEYQFPQLPDWDSNKQHTVGTPLFSTHGAGDLGLLRPEQSQRPPDLVVSETPSPSPPAASPAQTQAPPLQPPNHAFNRYYHYYHHPKIPLFNPPQDAGAAAEVPENPSPANTYGFLVLPPGVQQPEANPGPAPPPAPHPYIPSAGPGVDHRAYASQPHPNFFFFPHMVKGEVKRLTPLPHDVATTTNVPDAPPLYGSPGGRPVHKDFNGSPDAHRPDAAEPAKHRPDWSRDPPPSEGEGVKLDEEERRSAPVTPPLPPSTAPEPAPPPHPYHYAPYYHYYQGYGPNGDHVSPTPPKGAPDTSSSSSSSSSSPAQHQTTSSPTESTYPAQNGHLYPYYYHHQHLSQPEERPAGSTGSESPLPSEPSVPQPPPTPPHGSYAQQHVYYGSGPPGGEEAEERLDYDPAGRHRGAESSVPWHLYATAATAAPPWAPACGPASDCSHSLGCCSYPVEGCTMGQSFVFVVPDSVLEPTVPPAAHPSGDSEASCAPQRLTSDPEVYVVPLDGCGVNKLMFGQTVVHLLEVHGIYSPGDELTSEAEDSPVRLMVACSSSPGSPGEVRVHVMDQPPPPPPPPPIQASAATVTVQLRLSTDESFSSFHPEAHLPLSAVRGRPLYLEVSLLEAPEEQLVLLVHSCMAHTAAPHSGWLPLYDGCPGRYDAQLLPSPDPHHTRRILVSSFLFLPSPSPSSLAAKGDAPLEDPEVYVFCSTEVCSAADGDCTPGCVRSELNRAPRHQRSSGS